MPRTAASRVPSGAAPLLGIGQVLARLQPEFPDLTPSKLRFLEEQGLVAPARTPSGYRKFSTVDVERIGFVLSMQRDHYLPLKVIRAHLEAVDGGRTPALPGATTAAAAAPRRFRRDDLAREAGVSATLVDEAVAGGILPPAEQYGEEALVLVEALAALAAVGIEPRHLRSIRVAAEREAALVERAIAPSRRGGDAADKARTVERARELARHLETIHSTALRGAIARLGR